MSWKLFAEFCSRLLYLGMTEHTNSHLNLHCSVSPVTGFVKHSNQEQPSMQYAYKSLWWAKCCSKLLSDFGDTIDRPKKKQFATSLTVNDCHCACCKCLRAVCSPLLTACCNKESAVLPWAAITDEPPADPLQPSPSGCKGDSVSDRDGSHHFRWSRLRRRRGERSCYAYTPTDGGEL